MSDVAIYNILARTTSRVGQRISDGDSCGCDGNSHGLCSEDLDITPRSVVAPNFSIIVSTPSADNFLTDNRYTHWSSYDSNSSFTNTLFPSLRALP